MTRETGGSAVPGARTMPAAAAGRLAVALLCFCAVAGTGPLRAEESSLEQRIQRVEDEGQIRSLLVEYGQCLDTLDFAAYSRLFAREGEWSGLLGEFTTVKGPDNIRAAMEKAFAARTYDPDRVMNLHLISNVRIDVDGDRATGYSKWTVLSRNDKDEPHVRLSGHYDDVYVREDGRWKFLSRTARRDIP